MRLAGPSLPDVDFQCFEQRLLQFVHLRWFLKVLSVFTNETNSAEKTSFRVVHLQRQQLIGKSENQVGEWPEARIVHLGSVEGKAVRKGHGVLLRGVPGANPQDLSAGDPQLCVYCLLPLRESVGF